MTAIYNEGIAGREATFETRPREPAEVAAWLEEGLPFVVAEGPAASSRASLASSEYSDRCVYGGVGEHGVYVAARGARPRASGATLLRELCAVGRARGLLQAHRAHLHDATPRAGRSTSRRDSRRSAIQRRHGRLDGEWRDCVLVERLLGRRRARPTARR